MVKRLPGLSPENEAVRRDVVSFAASKEINDLCDEAALRGVSPRHVAQVMAAVVGHRDPELAVLMLHSVKQAILLNPPLPIANMQKIALQLGGCAESSPVR